MNENMEPNPWEQIENEREDYYSLFTIYLNQGYKRSYSRVAETSGLCKQTIFRIAKAWNWQERVDSYRKFTRETQQEELEANYKGALAKRLEKKIMISGYVDDAIDELMPLLVEFENIKDYNREMKKVKFVLAISKALMSLIDMTDFSLDSLVEDTEKLSKGIEILMETDYGAPELKKTYQRFFGRGLILAILIHIVIVSGYLGFNYWDKLKAEELLKNSSQQRIINVTDLEPPPSATDEETPPPPKVEELKAAPPKDLTALEPKPVAKEKAEEQTIKTQNELEQIKTPVSSFGDTGKFTYSGPVKVEEKKVEEKIEKKEKEVVKDVFQSYEVEKAPDCINLAQVKSSIVYPEMARQMGKEGKVLVKVLVGTDGSVIKIGTLSGDEVFYDEVSSKARDLQFTPGLQNGKPVKVWVSVPFSFKLK